MNRILIICIIFLASCSVSHLDRFPGKSLPSFPEELHGEYKIHVGGFRGIFAGKKLDSVLIRISAGKTESLNENGWTPEFVIDSTHILSTFGNYYYMSTKDQAEPTLWNANVFWKNGKDLYISSVNSTDKNLVNDKLKNYLQLNFIQRSKGKSTITVVNIKDKKLLSSLSTITTDSPDSVLYYTVNDTLLTRFVKNEIGVKNSIRFQKVISNQQTK